MRRVSWTALILVIALAAGAGAAMAQEEDRAGIVISYGEGQTAQYCVELTEPEISGYELLRRSGVAIEANAAGLGNAVCRLDETGCPATNCFCQCRGNNCEYWSYWHLLEGEWQYSAAGASQYLVQPGDVDGWSWGPGSVTQAIAPPDITLAEICAPAELAGQSEASPVGGAPGQPAATNAPAVQQAESEDAGSVSWLYYVLAGAILLGLLAWALLGRRKVVGN